MKVQVYNCEGARLEQSLLRWDGHLKLSQNQKIGSEMPQVLYGALLEAPLQ